MDMETILIAAIACLVNLVFLLVAVMVFRKPASAPAPAPIAPPIDVAAILNGVLDRFVEQSKSTNETITGVYSTPVAAPTTDLATIAAMFEEPARMTTLGDFDDTDPTDQYLKPDRPSAAMIPADGDGNPFGIPGLIVEARKDAPRSFSTEDFSIHERLGL